jgi:hypothetical protein
MFTSYVTDADRHRQALAGRFKGTLSTCWPLSAAERPVRDAESNWLRRSDVRRSMWTLQQTVGPLTVRSLSAAEGPVRDAKWKCLWRSDVYRSMWTLQQIVGRWRSVPCRPQRNLYVTQNATDCDGPMCAGQCEHYSKLSVRWRSVPCRPQRDLYVMQNANVCDGPMCTGQCGHYSKLSVADGPFPVGRRGTCMWRRMQLTVPVRCAHVNVNTAANRRSADGPFPVGRRGICTWRRMQLTVPVRCAHVNVNTRTRANCRSADGKLCRRRYI